VVHRESVQALLSSLTLPFTLKRRYQVSSIIGVGAIAYLLLAHDIERERNVVVKLYRQHLTDDVAKRMHLSEIKALSLLKDPRVPELLDHGEIKGRPYVIMEFLEGRSLSQVERREVAERHLTREIILQVLECVAHMHSRGIIHADIKPSQILFNDIVRVIDFGSSLLSGSGRMEDPARFLAGTPGYLAPEAMEFKLGEFTDIYSVGCVLAYLLTGNPRSRRILDYYLRGLQSWLPIVVKATAPVEKRYRTVAEFKEDIQNRNRLRMPMFVRGANLFELAQDLVTIGRTGHIRIDDDLVSRVHARIIRSPSGAFVLENLGTNGTFVFENDGFHEIERYNLNDGDVISILPPGSGVRNYLFTFRER